MKIEWNRRIFRVLVTRVRLERHKETFSIRGNNKTIIVESNKPWLESKSLHKWEPEYKIVSGKFHTPGFERALIKALQNSIGEYEKSRRSTK